jgi:hypothetical protein
MAHLYFLKSVLGSYTSKSKVVPSNTQHVFTLLVVEMVRGIIKAENNENEFSFRIPMYNNGD